MLMFFAGMAGNRIIAQGSTTGTPSTVLFIGDSLTYFQKGVYTHFERLAAGLKPPVLVTTDHSTFPGAFLHRLWDLKDPVKAVDKGSYDVVVLQEDIPETTVADFREYVHKFVAEIRKVHARPVLFMAWAYSRLDWISMAKIAQAHRDAEKELDVEVAPVGLAWQQASKQRPWMDFYGPDQEHPSIYGTYLAACVLYSTIYGHDSTGSTYAASGISPAEAAFLRGVAWQTVQEYRAGRI
jgi:hypothetical protein